jgi:hypothetical protein
MDNDWFRLQRYEKKQKRALSFREVLLSFREEMPCTRRFAGCRGAFTATVQHGMARFPATASLQRMNTD